MAIINGTETANTLNGTSSSDRIRGRAGNDTINGRGGNDYLFGDAGNDTIDGGAGSDYVDGGAGNDDLDGGRGNDTIYGGTGNDELDGEGGNDVLVGGAGYDHFEYEIETQDGGVVGGRDSIGDFRRGVDELEIKLDDEKLTFDLLDSNNDGRVGAGDDGVTVHARGWGGFQYGSLTIDVGSIAEVSGTHTLTLFGVTALRASDFDS